MIEIMNETMTLSVLHICTQSGFWLGFWIGGIVTIILFLIWWITNNIIRGKR